VFIYAKINRFNFY